MDKELREREVGLLLMTDMWSFFGSHNKIQTLKKLKRIYPDIPVVIGGQFATIHFQDVIKLPEVDFVIRGDGEKAIVMLAQYLKDNTGNPADIPGLVYKERDKVIINEEVHLLSAEEFDSHDYLNCGIIKDYWEFYRKVTRQTFLFHPLLIHKGCKKICRRCYGASLPASNRMYFKRPSLIIPKYSQSLYMPQSPVISS